MKTGKTALTSVVQSGGKLRRKPRSQVLGTIYLLHFLKKLHHAGHYLGWTEGPVEDRIARHRLGSGARLVSVVTQAGIGMEIAFTRPGTREDERRLKRGGSSRRICPICRGEIAHGTAIE